MRAMWRVHGKPGGAQPGLVAKPYTLQDARDRLAEVAGDKAFADAFFDKYVEGREAIDYAPLLARAGYTLRRRSAGWTGLSGVDASGTITTLLPWGSPAFEAGLDQGDVIVDVDGKSLTPGALQSALRAKQPGDRLLVTFKRRDGATGKAAIVAKEDPAFELVPVEASGGTLTPAQQAFREAWLGSKARR